MRWSERGCGKRDEGREIDRKLEEDWVIKRGREVKGYSDESIKPLGVIQ